MALSKQYQAHKAYLNYQKKPSQHHQGPLAAQTTPREGQTLSDYLWEQTAEYQQQALDSNSIHGLREGCLDPSQFGGYMVDDSVYCNEGMRSLNIAARRSGANTTLRKFLKSEAESWKGYWEWLYNVWHIKKTKGIELGEAASNYVNHVRNVAENEEPVYTILALTPCAKLWPWLGAQIGSGSRDFGVYTTWVEENLVPSSSGYLEYQDHVEWAYQAGIVSAERALQVFTQSFQNEVQFFNSVERCQARSHTGMWGQEHLIYCYFYSTNLSSQYYPTQITRN